MNPKIRHFVSFFNASIVASAMLWGAKCLFIVVGVFAHNANAADSTISFRDQIAPLLVAKCEACHGERVQKGDFRLDTFQHFVDPPDDGQKYVVPGKPSDSYLLDLLVSSDPETRMPKNGPPLTNEQINTIRKWIEQGAAFDGADPKLPLVEIMTPAVHPDPPTHYDRILPLTAIAFSNDEQQLAVSGYREVTIWNAADGKFVRRIKNVAVRTYALAFQPSGNLLAVGGGDSGRLGEVRLFDATTGELQRVVASMRDSVLDVKFSPDGTLLAASSADRSIRVFEVATGKRTNLITSHGDAVTAIAFSPDGKRLAAVSLDRAAKVHDLATNKVLANHTEHIAPLFSVAFSPDGEHVYSSGKEKSIRVWNSRDGKKIADVGGCEGDVLKLIVNGDVLYAAGADRRVRQFATTDRRALRVSDMADDWIYAVAVAANSRQIAGAGFDGIVRVWNAEQTKPALTFPAQGENR